MALEDIVFENTTTREGIGERGSGTLNSPIDILSESRSNAGALENNLTFEINIATIG